MATETKTQILYSGKAHKEFFDEFFREVPAWHYFTNLADLKDDKDIVLIIDKDQYDRAEELKAALAARNSGLFARLIVLPDQVVPPQEFDELTDYLKTPLTNWLVLNSLRRLQTTLTQKKYIQQLESSLALRSQELAELNKIGIALSAERDPDVLLEMILTKAREITSADAGSLYLVEKNPDIPAHDKDFWVDKQLRFKLAQNDSLSASYQEFVMPVEKKSMAGYTALTGRPLNIPDAYNIPPDSEFQHNRSFDQKMGYRTKSVLCLPMRSHEGEMIGVLQLINRKVNWTDVLRPDKEFDQKVIPFDERCVELVSSLASQAAVSIENMKLYEEIKRLFEGFIVASVHAIEQRDPTTSGHSERVATLTVDLAKEIDRVSDGPFKNVKFTRDDIQQIKYASLLHDFGKIGVREHVLVKAKKLYPNQLEAIKFRFKYIKKALEQQYNHKKIQYLLEKSREEALQYISALNSEFEDQLRELDDYLEFILKANEPRVLEEGSYERLREIGSLTFRENGTVEPYLTEKEIHLLSIARGSLSEEERQEIESHVIHSFNFLSRIPWARHLKNIPQIAYAHHEKLNGTGYPRGLAGPQIPLPSKMMTISDIYDALTAWDRPYKKAVPTERALTILEYEVKEGKLDPHLFKIFVEAKIFTHVKRPEES